MFVTFDLFGVLALEISNIDNQKYIIENSELNWVFMEDFFAKSSRVFFTRERGVGHPKSTYIDKLYRGIKSCPNDILTQM